MGLTVKQSSGTIRCGQLRWGYEKLRNKGIIMYT